MDGDCAGLPIGSTTGFLGSKCPVMDMDMWAMGADECALEAIGDRLHPGPGCSGRPYTGLTSTVLQNRIAAQGWRKVACVGIARQCSAVFGS